MDKEEQVQTPAAPHMCLFDLVIISLSSEAVD